MRAYHFVGETLRDGRPIPPAARAAAEREVVAMGAAGSKVSRWIKEYGKENARRMVLEHVSGIYVDIGPVFRAAYLTAIGR